MSAYFGSDETRRLQQKSDELTDWIKQTPGACATGRMMAADDWRTLGWDVVKRHLNEDGMFTFRWISPRDVTDARARLADIGASLFEWSGFMGEADTIRAQSERCLNTPLDSDLAEGHAENGELKEMQAFLTGHGITPFSTDLMGGKLWPARSYVIKDSERNLIACGFAGIVQNRFSQLADCSWVGLIATDPTFRGRGLGNRMMARLCQISLDELGASRVMAFAAPDNAASIAMLTRAGLEAKPEKSCVAVFQGGRPTR